MEISQLTQRVKKELKKYCIFQGKSAYFWFKWVLFNYRDRQFYDRNIISSVYRNFLNLWHSWKAVYTYWTDVKGAICDRALNNHFWRTKTKKKLLIIWLPYNTAEFVLPWCNNAYYGKKFFGYIKGIFI